MKMNWNERGGRVLVLCGVLAASGAVRGVWACGEEDEDITTAQVGAWTISSSEVPGEEDATSRRYPHFKLAHLMDNNAKTPWVFRGQGRANAFDPSWGKRHAIALSRESGVMIDEIRIMNGYNKRADLFKRNDRVVEVGIAIDGEKLKTAVLSDKMGWHSISIPRQKVEDIVIEFIGVRKGSGRDNDICLSELAFYNKGKKIKS